MSTLKEYIENLRKQYSQDKEETEQKAEAFDHLTGGDTSE